MARPQKTGLDYFPLDVDIDQDDKVALIEAQHGLKGFAIVIKLLMKIYKNSYFYEWTEKEQLLFSKRVNVNINEVNVIINDCVKWGLFDGEVYESHKILTSEGIQRRYLEAVGRRQKVKMNKIYLLLDEETINVYKNLIIVNINSNTDEVNDNINPQSKVKKSKEKKSKENNNVNINDDIKNILQDDNENSSCSGDFNIFNYMQQRGFITISSMIAQQINADIDMYSLEEVKQAIDIADNNGKHTYSYVQGILKRRRAGIDEKNKNQNEFEKIKEKIANGEEVF